MTIAELIEVLKAMPQELPVMSYDLYGCSVMMSSEHIQLSHEWITKPDIKKINVVLIGDSRLYEE